MESSHAYSSASMLACSKVEDPHNWGQLDQLNTTVVVECIPHIPCFSLQCSTPDSYTVNAQGYWHAHAVQTHARHCTVFTLMHSFTSGTMHNCWDTPAS